MKLLTIGKKGFTLVEMTVSVALYSFLLVTIIASYKSASNVRQKGIVVRESQQTNRVGMEILARDIRFSRDVRIASIAAPTSENMIVNIEETSNTGNALVVDLDERRRAVYFLCKEETPFWIEIVPSQMLCYAEWINDENSSGGAISISLSAVVKLSSDEIDISKLRFTISSIDKDIRQKKRGFVRIEMTTSDPQFVDNSPKPLQHTNTTYLTTTVSLRNYVNE